MELQFGTFIAGRELNIPQKTDYNPYAVIVMHHRYMYDVGRHTFGYSSALLLGEADNTVSQGINL